MRIISGGQTGIDQIALDAAIESGIEHGGWCPKGRLAEDGTIPEKYQLKESASKNYAVRTEKNIIESDGTLVLYWGKATGGTNLTIRLAAKHDKPCKCLDFQIFEPAVFPDVVEQTNQWIASHEIVTLNIAGPRKSNSPELAAYVYPFLIDLFRSHRKRNG